MCLSKLGQIVYGALALVVVGLILASMFTKEWREMENKVEKGNIKKVINFEMFAFTCFSGTDSRGNAINKCTNWFNGKQTWEKVVIGAMFIGLLFAIAAFVWNLLTFCACFCKGTIMRPLAPLSGATATCLLIALVLYYVKNREEIELIRNKDELTHQGNITYSFYMAVGALVASIANIVVGTMVVCMADQCI